MENSLPKGWVEIELKYLGEYINGRAFKPSEWKNTGLPIIRIQNLNNDKAQFNYSDIEHEAKYKVKKGELLMAWSASLGVYLWEGNDAWLNQHIFKIKHNSHLVTKKFFYYTLRSAIDEFYMKTHGSGMVHITKPVFEAHKVYLPPLAEQRRIVEKLDALLAKINLSKERLDKIPAILKNFRQSVLAAAVSGELTREWRASITDNINGHNLLPFLLQMRKDQWSNNIGSKQKKQSAYKNPKGPNTIPEIEIPTEWSWVSLEQSSIIITDGDHNPPKRIPDGVPHLTAKNIKCWKVIFDRCTYISTEDFEKSRSRYEPQEKDIIVTCVGTVGQTAIVPPNCTFSADRNLAAIRLVKGMFLPEIVQYVLNTNEWQHRLSNSSGSSAQPHIYLNDLRAIPIPLIPIAEQIEIVRRVEELFHFADSIETRYQKAKAWFDKIPQAILAKAFRGEMVEQDENDEPVTILLERIKAEKETTGTKNKNTGSKKRTKSVPVE